MTIKSFINRERMYLRIMQVIDRYVINGTPECDLVDGSGVIYTGCTIMSLGGADTDRMSTPPIDAEVLTLTQGGGAPYIIGALAENQKYVEVIELDSAGEYPLNQIGIDHSELKSKGARIIAGDEGIYLTPKTRIQGTLEISSGATPLQHLAIAEPTIDTLTQYQARIIELTTAIQSLQTALSDMKTALVFDIPAGTPTFLEDVVMPSDPISPTPPPNDTISSDLATIER
tara:strand:- start:2800 stop:3489 length:690 start_codon:yes stop_codon:yes gene_type:complete